MKNEKGKILFHVKDAQRMKTIFSRLKRQETNTTFDISIY